MEVLIGSDFFHREGEEHGPVAVTTPANDTIDLFHAASGLCSEAAELLEAMNSQDHVTMDLVNLREELGDLLWYIAMGCRAVGMEMSALPDVLVLEPLRGSLQSTPALITVEAGHLMDALKKQSFYGKPITRLSVVERLARILRYVIRLASLTNQDIGIICAVNIAKLRKRYPEKFCTDQALNRNLAAEREILESPDSPTQGTNTPCS